LSPDAAALQAGADNPLSAKAQIDKAYNQGSLDAIYAANARGTLGSGASTAAVNTLEQNRQLQQYQAQNDALSTIRNALQGYTSAQQSAADNLRSTQYNIMSALAQMPGPVYQTQSEETPTDTSPEPNAPVPGTANLVQSAKPGTVQWGGTSMTKSQLVSYL